MAFDMQRLSLTEIKHILYSSEDKQRQRIIRLLEKDRRTGAKRLITSFNASRKKSEKFEKEFRQLCSFEEKLRCRGFTNIAGVDEAGRGAFAGPLVAAAVILPPDFFLPGLRESKQLLPGIREEFYEEITDNACDWHVEIITPSYIDRKGLHKANLYVLEKAVLNLSKTPDYVLSDGFSLYNLRLPRTSLIAGDRLSVSIAAASIVAKIERDRLMVSYSKEFSDYGFENHKGYGTKEHFKALQKFGPSPIHRLSFKPVRECIELRLKDL